MNFWLVCCILSFLLFQFHKGTIWTPLTGEKFFHKGIFQFHKGTIWTHFRPRSATLNYHFNSIKVQFELYRCRQCFLLRHFNSIKVQFEPTRFSRQIRLPTFQFHKGTIWTLITHQHQETRPPNFNSIKVQFERHNSKGF